MVSEFHDDNDEGWGYIDGEDGKKYGVHWSEIKTPGYYTLKKDMKVTFESKEVSGGILAENVQIEDENNINEKPSQARGLF